LPPERRTLALANSPVTYIAAGRSIPPFLIVHGDEDAIVPFNQSVRLYEALRTSGHDAVFYRVKGGNHGWNFWSPELMQLVIEFFDRILKVPGDSSESGTTAVR
jgi:dipeptidyl aminopeptidase/acylaminoacyl peptidase